MVQIKFRSGHCPSSSASSMASAVKFSASLCLALALSASFVCAQTASPTPAASPASSVSPAPASTVSPSPNPKTSKTDKDKKKKDKDKDKKKDKSAPGSSASPGASPKDAADDFQIPVPINEPVKGIRIPHYDEKGKLIMVFNADVARKIDERHLTMENLKIDATGDDGKKFYVEMPAAAFDMDTRLLSGDQRVLIKREDFTITGQKGEFYVKTRFAKVIGDVKMIIFNTENFTK